MHQGSDAWEIIQEVFMSEGLLAATLRVLQVRLQYRLPPTIPRIRLAFVQLSLS